MDALSKLLSLSVAEKEQLGLTHTLDEILQQPGSWRRTCEKISSLAAPIQQYLVRAGIDREEQPLGVLLVGAGTSDYIGKSVRTLLQKEWRRDVHAVPSTELLTNIEDHIIPGRTYLWISFSRSGDSSEGVAVLEAALEKFPEIKHLIVTCNRYGKMVRSFNDRENVFSIVLDDEVNDRGLAMTSSFSNMVIVAQALAHFRRLDTYSPIVERLATAASTTLPVAADFCENLVREGFSRVCFLGTGALNGAAIESGLKVLELTNGQVISLSESFLGLRHGPLSAIDSDTLVVGFLSSNQRRSSFELDLLQEICDKRLTDKCLVVKPNQLKNPLHFPHQSLSLGLSEEVPDLYLPPVAVLVGQLLGLFASLKEGLRPDEPSPHGAINRVVSNVTIH